MLNNSWRWPALVWLLNAVMDAANGDFKACLGDCIIVALSLHVGRQEYKAELYAKAP